MAKTIEFSIEEGNIISFDADVVALKYAQNFYGPDLHIAHALDKAGIFSDEIHPQVGDSLYIDSRKVIKARNVVFTGVPDLDGLGYQEIREFAVNVLEFLSQKAPTTKHLAMTIHGPGYGLDEVESLFAQFAGFLQAIKNGTIPSYIERISIVEINSARAKRLRAAFDINFASMENMSKTVNRWAYRLQEHQEFESTSKRSFGGSPLIEEAGIRSDEKPHAFVAMPFRKDMEDIYYYGIQRAVHANDLLCERIDQEAFTGYILKRIKQKIKSATVVIADLSGANPNVYLEVGYAWGKDVPTILLIKETDKLSFDVQGQRSLKYETIKELEETLTKELAGLLGR